MTDEDRQIIADIVTRIRDLLVSLDAGTRAVHPLPNDAEQLEALPPLQKLVASGYLKTVEQLEDQLARLFRTILVVNDVDLTGLFARDIADMMDKLEIVDDADRWSALVKLRNKLVHDYPLTGASRLARLIEADAAAPFIKVTAERALAYLQRRGWLEKQS